MGEDNLQSRGSSGRGEPEDQTTPNPDAQGPVILLIDDDDLQAITRSRLFAQSGAASVVAHTAEEARQAAALHRFDLVIVDINLTGAAGDRSGIALAHELRRLDPDVPIVGATSWYSDEFSEEDLSLFQAWHSKGSTLEAVREWRAKCIKLMLEHYARRQLGDQVGT